ncbi:hypothetical protein H7Y40_02785 [Pedobacter sp.]|nr:hypothetical protein [Candidatus Saccharibacteria bacterium]
MSEHVSRFEGGKLHGFLRSVDSAGGSEMSREEHESSPHPALLNIDDSSMSDVEVSEHVGHVLIEHFNLEQMRLKSQDSLTHPKIIVHSLLTELGAEADLDKLRETALESGEPLSDNERSAIKHTLEIDMLLSAATQLLEKLATDKLHYKFVRETLEAHIETHHQRANALRAAEQLKDKLPDHRLSMTITSRLLKTMLYVNDNPALVREILKSEQAPSQ